MQIKSEGLIQERMKKNKNKKKIKIQRETNQNLVWFFNMKNKSTAVTSR